MNNITTIISKELKRSVHLPKNRKWKMNKFLALNMPYSRSACLF
jgi:hypothetical protein